MKRHTQIYMNFFGFKVAEDCVCEIPGCGQPCTDVCHIEARQMGGNPSGDKDHITNLMGKCRPHHLQYGDVRADKEWLKKVHNEYIMLNGKVDQMIKHGILGEEDMRNDI